MANWPKPCAPGNASCCANDATGDKRKINAGNNGKIFTARQDSARDNGASGFIAGNPDVNFVFVTIWNPSDGRDVLEKNGVGAERNFQLLLHPNTSRKKGEKVTQLLGIPISWLPTTWIFRDGKLCYAMNYGELHFPMLQQLIRDSSDSWDH